MLSLIGSSIALFTPVALVLLLLMARAVVSWAGCGQQLDLILSTFVFVRKEGDIISKMQTVYLRARGRLHSFP